MKAWAGFYEIFCVFARFAAKWSGFASGPREFVGVNFMRLGDKIFLTLSNTLCIIHSIENKKISKHILEVRHGIH